MGGFDNTPGNNPVTDAGATLGRVLFYDVALSANNTVACASCHIQSEAFSDPRQLSIGFDGGRTGRNSMPIINAAYYDNGRMFWDERADSVEEQVLMPIQDAVEMGLTLPLMVQRVEAQPYYERLFEDAFGDSAVSSNRIALALAQFVRSIVSYRSRYDEGIGATGDRNTPFPNFTEQENRGKQIFMGNRGNCASCHMRGGGGGGGNDAVFMIGQARNNGLDANTNDDQGVGGVSGNNNDNGEFKSPSLRNIALTGPYMHDGRFNTLRRVIEFYRDEVENHPNLHPEMRGNNGQPRRLNLSNADMDALEAFMHTLTDTTLTNDPRYADPFE